MSLDLFTAKDLLGWCLVLNVALYLWWFLVYVLAHDFMDRMHRKWFKLSVETFDAIHYGGLGIYKILMLQFLFVPYVALHFLIG